MSTHAHMRIFFTRAHESVWLSLHTQERKKAEEKAKKEAEEEATAKENDANNTASSAGPGSEEGESESRISPDEKDDL